MFQYLHSFDLRLFHLINSGLANPFFDWMMPVVRNPFVWAPLYIFFAAFFIVNFRRQGVVIIIFGLLAFALSDQLSAHVLKLLFHRLRPCNNPDIVEQARLLIPCGSGFSFPSSHAANHFTVAVFLISVMRWSGKEFLYLSPGLLFWAALVCFAQVYVGIHYPLDVTAGAMLGIFIGYFMAKLCRNNLQRPRIKTPPPNPPIP